MAGSAPTNNSAVDFEKQQAAEADAQEAQRQANLTQGQAAINAIFDPQPVMQTTQTPFDWSTFNPQAYQQATSAAQSAANSNLATAPPGSGGVPAGYTAVQVAAPKTTTATPPIRLATTSAGLPQTTAPQGRNGGGLTWALKGPDGKIYNQGDPLSISTQTPDPSGATTGGFGSDFYDAYNQKVLDYYQPQEQKQYDEAQRDLTYSLARSGNLTSSAAGDATGELGYQDALNKANIVANANSQTGQLQSQIQQNKSNLINQLYTTDDPSLANSMAETSAKASQLQDPTLTPLASVFTPIVTGATSAIQTAASPYQNAYGTTTQTGAAPVTSAIGAGSSKLSSGGYS